MIAYGVADIVVPAIGIAYLLLRFFGRGICDRVMDLIHDERNVL